MLTGQPPSHSSFGEARASGDESLRIERVLATARVLLASSSLLAIYLDPAQPTHYAALAYGLLAFYVLHSVLLFVLLCGRSGLSPRGTRIQARGPPQPLDLFSTKM